MVHCLLAVVEEVLQPPIYLNSMNFPGIHRVTPHIYNPPNELKERKNDQKLHFFLCCEVKMQSRLCDIQVVRIFFLLHTEGVRVDGEQSNLCG